MLLDEPAASDEAAIKDQGRRLLALGCPAVLIKGGHGQGPESTDYLFSANATIALAAPRIPTDNTHGTGCSLSSAIAAYLAKGEAMESAVRNAKAWISAAIAAADRLEVGHGSRPHSSFSPVLLTQRPLAASNRACYGPPMLGQGSANISSPGLLHAKAWAEAYELIDLQLSPLGLRAIDALSLGLGDVVLDIGCGAGQTLLQLAEQVGTEGQVIGVDVAPLLLEIAKRRTEPLGQVRLIQLDAQYLDLPSESTDAVFSRFGVLTFNDPVAAFANFRRILRPSGALAFCCWRSLQENELDHLPISAAGFQSTVDEKSF